jgi:hypothetical protein
VPSDTTSVPVGPAVANADEDIRSPPVAIECTVDGRDARRCPDCDRTFLMKPAFVDKTIRCRGCKASFRVAATQAHVRQSPGNVAARHAPALVPQRLQLPPPPSPGTLVPPPVPPSLTPGIFEDIGDILDEFRPGEKIASVVRPRNAAALAGGNADQLAAFIAVVSGGLCALPITQLILWWIVGKDPLRIAASLPGILQWLAPSHLRP